MASLLLDEHSVLLTLPPRSPHSPYHPSPAPPFRFHEDDVASYHQHHSPEQPELPLVDITNFPERIAYLSDPETPHPNWWTEADFIQTLTESIPFGPHTLQAVMNEFELLPRSPEEEEGEEESFYSQEERVGDETETELYSLSDNSETDTPGDMGTEGSDSSGSSSTSSNFSSFPLFPSLIHSSR
jgi:hypothetical protein